MGTQALSALFNSGQLYLSVLAAGLVLRAGGVSAHLAGLRVSDVLVIGTAAVTMYISNLLLVATAVALTTSRSPFVSSATLTRSCSPSSRAFTSWAPRPPSSRSGLRAS